MRGIIFCDNHEPGGILIKAVDYARTLHPSDGGKAPDVVQKGIYQRSCPIPRAGVHYQSRLLIDHDDRIVLIYDVKGDVLWLERKRLRLRNLYGNAVIVLTL